MNPGIVARSSKADLNALYGKAVVADQSIRRLVLVEIDAATPLDAEAKVGRALIGVPGNPFVRQTGVILSNLEAKE